jgi:hypothetical protein
LGLKAGYWTKDGKDPLEFREIVGWVTITIRDPRTDAPPENTFQAVVYDYTMYPTLARSLLQYRGVFPKNASEEEAKALVLEWSKPRAEHVQPNIPGIGQA